MLLMIMLSVERTTACTAFIAGRKATTDGTTLLMHTDDCLNCDFRLARTLPREGAEVADVQPVLTFRETYPREVSERAATYSPSKLDRELPAELLSTWRSAEWAENQTIGELRRLDSAVSEALGAASADSGFYGTLEGLYSIANSKEVAIVESTSGASPLLFSLARTHRSMSAQEGALWDISALTKAALAVCPTARCAIDLMGYLAVMDGFYGGHGALGAALLAPLRMLLASAERRARTPFPSFTRPLMRAGAPYECAGKSTDVAANGESLFVADPHESWVFQIAPLPPNVQKAAGVLEGDEAPPSGGHSAVWVAQV